MWSRDWSFKAAQSPQMTEICVFVSCGWGWVWECVFGVGFVVCVFGCLFFFSLMVSIALELRDRPKRQWNVVLNSKALSGSGPWQRVQWQLFWKAVDGLNVLCCCTSAFPQLSLLCQFMPAASCRSRFVCTCNEQGLSKLLNSLCFSKLKGNNVWSALHKLLTSALCVFVKHITEKYSSSAFVGVNHLLISLYLRDGDAFLQHTTSQKSSKDV